VRSHLSPVTKEAQMSKSTTQLVLNMQRKTSESAVLLESRWTYATLRRRNPDIARRLHEQRNLFAEACVRGSAREVVEHGEALCRGYALAARALEEAGEKDDAYLLGVDLVTGLKVAIGQQRVATARVREVHGQDVVWLTPDEVARIMAGIESFKAISAVKKMFPSAEIVDRYESEGNVEVIYDSDAGPESGGTDEQ
jgi:hypothetical protein